MEGGGSYMDKARTVVQIIHKVAKVACALCVFLLSVM